MWLYKLAWRHVRWSASLYKKFFNLVPWRTTAVVVFTLFSQFAMMAAFILPLKVIILIGTDGIPGYFPQSFADYGKDALVVFLSSSALVFYLIHLLAERVVDRNAELGASEVLRKSRKLTLFPNQGKLAKTAYQRFSKGLAASIFSFVVMSLYGVIYPLFLAVLVGYLVAVSVVISLGGKVSSRFYFAVKEKSSNVISLLSGVGFLLLFSFMVIDFTFWNGVGVIYAVISLILVRQLFQRMNGAIKDAVSLSSQRLKINSMFFHGHVLQDHHNDLNSPKLWSLVDSPTLRSDISRLLSGTIQDKPVCHADVLEVSWRQTGVVDVIAFHVAVKWSSGDLACTNYLVKIFSHKHEKIAVNESEILTAGELSSLPVCKFLAVGELQGFKVHILQLPVVDGVAKKDVSQCIPYLLMQCWEARPTQELVDRYRRSHPLLPQRMLYSMVDRLSAVSDGSCQDELVAKFSDNLDRIVRILDDLPLCIVNLEINDCSLVRSSSDNRLLLTHWGRWALEPVGAVFPTRPQSIDLISQLLDTAGQSNIELQGVDCQDVILCAYLYEFERMFKRQRYHDAIELLRPVMTCLEAKKVSYVPSS